MLSRSQIKHIQSLQRKKYRTLHQQYLIEGPKIVEEAVVFNAPKIEIFATAMWVNAQEDLLSKYSPVVNIVSDKDLDRISQLKTANQVLALLPIEKAEPRKKLSGLNLMLENIQDPGNLGTIIRCADWFGASAVFCTPDCADLYNPKVLQACMGSNFYVPVYYLEAETLIENAHVPIYAATVSGENLYNVKPQENVLILIGNESKGLSAALKESCDTEITIPKKGKAESLNAANATAVILSYFANALR
ncbi:MAG: RNA methyltransferase [Chitinophagales bacterium]